MKNRYLFAAGVISTAIGACIFWPTEETVARAVSTNQYKEYSRERVTVADKAFHEPVVQAPEDGSKEKLESYLLERLESWMNKSELSAENVARYTSTAEALATVAVTESPAWEDDVTKAKTAVLVLGLGFTETRDREYVERGWCNNLNRIENGVFSEVESIQWRKSKIGIATMNVGGPCDGGYAYTRFQTHPEEGFAFTKNDVMKISVAKHLNPDPDAEIELIDGKKLIADKETAARVAWRIVRRSIRNTGSLIQYTGEGRCPCPKAKIRLDFGLSQYKKHPFQG
jgi:hypothetical protein